MEYSENERKKILEIADLYRKVGWDIILEGQPGYWGSFAGKYTRADIMLYHNDKLYGIIEIKRELDITKPDQRRKIMELQRRKDLFDLFILTDGNFVSIFIKGERFIETGRPITPDEVDTFIKRKAIREASIEDVEIDTKSLYLQNVRENINELSSFVLSESDIDYIIRKTKFMKTLENDPDIINISPRQTASRIILSAALDTEPLKL